MLGCVLYNLGHFTRPVSQHSRHDLVPVPGTWVLGCHSLVACLQNVAPRSFCQRTISGIFEKDYKPTCGLKTVHWYVIITPGKPQASRRSILLFWCHNTKLVEKHRHQWDWVEKWFRRASLWMRSVGNAGTNLFHLYLTFYISTRMMYDRNLCLDKSERAFSVVMK